MANQETLAQFTGHPMINQAQLAQQQALYHQQLLQVIRNSIFPLSVIKLKFLDDERSIRANVVNLF